MYWRGVLVLALITSLACFFIYGDAILNALPRHLCLACLTLPWLCYATYRHLAFRAGKPAT